MCTDINLHTRKAQLDRKNREIAQKMTKFGYKTSEDSVGTYYSGQAGIPIEKFSAFAYAHDFKLVDKHARVIDSDDELMYLNAGKKYFELKMKLKAKEAFFREHGIDINEMLAG